MKILFIVAILIVFIIASFLFPKSDLAKEGVRYFGKKALKKLLFYGGVAIIFISLVVYDIYKDPYLSVGLFEDADEEYEDIEEYETTDEDSIDPELLGKFQFLASQGIYKKQDSYLEIEFTEDYKRINIRTSSQSPGEIGVLDEINHHTLTYLIKRDDANEVIRLSIANIKGSSSDPITISSSISNFNEIYTLYSVKAQPVAESINQDNSNNQNNTGKIENFTPELAINQQFYKTTTEDETADSFFQITFFPKSLEKRAVDVDMYYWTRPRTSSQIAGFKERNGDMVTYYSRSNGEIITVNFANVQGTAEDTIVVHINGKTYTLSPYTP